MKKIKIKRFVIKHRYDVNKENCFSRKQNDEENISKQNKNQCKNLNKKCFFHFQILFFFSIFKSKVNFKRKNRSTFEFKLINNLKSS